VAHASDSAHVQTMMRRFGFVLVVVRRLGEVKTPINCQIDGGLSYLCADQRPGNLS
jgi:hypothetical protein